MTSRERVMLAVKHMATDRLPVDYCTRSDVKERLKRKLGLNLDEDLYRKLGIDFRRFGVRFISPSFEARVNGVLGGASEKSGAKYIFHSDGTYEDMWGVVFRPSDSQLYDGWVTGPFAGNDDLDSFPWPSLSGIEEIESIGERIMPFAEYATLGTFNYPFKTCWMMRGLEDYLCDTIGDVSFARELWKRVSAYELEKAIRFIKAGGDIVGFSGDIAMQNTMLVSPAAWRAIDKPLFAEMISKIKEVNPNALVYYHSDGNMEEVLPDLIEIGVDIVNPIQPESMDVSHIYRTYGSRVALHGTISIQETLPKGTLKDVRGEVQNRISLAKNNGGLVVAPSNHVQNDTPLENILEIYKTIGSYKE